MAAFESLLIAVLALWGCLSFCYALRVPVLPGILIRHNKFQALVNWTMFAKALDPASPPTEVELSFRDRNAAGWPGDWTPVRLGYPSPWRSFLWLPERRIIRRIEDLSNDIKYYAEATPPAAKTIRAELSILEAYLQTIHPLLPGNEREVRINMRATSGWAGGSEARGEGSEEGERIVFSFCAQVHG